MSGTKKLHFSHTHFQTLRISNLRRPGQNDSKKILLTLPCNENIPKFHMKTPNRSGDIKYLSPRHTLQTKN